MRTLTLYNLGIKITDLKVRVNSIRICKSAFTFLNFFLKNANHTSFGIL